MMTDGNPRPEHEPTPPASTGWTGAPTGSDEELAPPFIPGSEQPSPGAGETAAPGEGYAAGTEGDSGGDPLPFGELQPEHGEEAEDEFPFDAFEIEGPQEHAAAGEGETDVNELADRLEEMAWRLRREGSTAAESDMASADRFTALLAGLLAGYLAGRR